MKKLLFTRIKSTRSLFFSSYKNEVVFNQNIIEVTAYPNLFLSGKYLIKSTEKDNFVFTLFRVIKFHNNEVIPDYALNESDFYYVYILKSGKKMMLYNHVNEGVIFKY